MAMKNDLNAEVKSDLINYVGVQDGAAYLVLGESVRGDRSTRIYYYNSSSTATADGDLILDATGIGVGRFIKLPFEEINPDWNSNSGYSQILNKPTLAGVATSGSYNDLSNKPTINTQSVTSGVSKSLNTVYQNTSSQNMLVSYTVDIACTLSLTTGQSGTVSLQYADNSGFSTNIVTVQSSINTNSGSLTIGLNLTQTATAAVTGVIPSGKYFRILTTNNTGTPTFTYRTGQEVLI